MTFDARRRYAAIAIATVVAVGASPAIAQTSSFQQVSIALTGEAPGDQAGLQLATGDLDGDRVEDLVIGAYGNDHGGQFAGAVYIEYGPIRRGFSLSRADVKLFAPLAGDYAGEGPIGVVDLDGDRRDDLVIGTPGSFLATQPGSPGKVGEAYLLYGGKRLRGVLSVDRVAHAVFTGAHLGDWLGLGAAGVGDLDADGLDDLVVGAPATAAYSGAAYLFYGRRQRFSGAVPVADADARVLGGRPGELFGYQAVGGDLDGDRASDLVITSAPFPAPQPATVAVFYGGKGTRLSGDVLALEADARLDMLSAPSSFPLMPWLSAAGDLTGDGTVDLVVGTGSATNAEGVAQTWVVAGGARLQGVDDLAAAARTTLVGVGSAGAVGQLDGDRRADLAASDAAAGRVSVFRGPLPAGTILPAVAAQVLVADGEDAGAALAVGDVTGDRRPDVVAAAPSAGGGVVYVVPRRR